MGERYKYQLLRKSNKLEQVLIIIIKKKNIITSLKSIESFLVSDNSYTVSKC